MGQAKLRGTYEQRRSESIASKTFYDAEQKRLDKWLEINCPPIVYVRGMGSIPSSRISHDEVVAARQYEAKQNRNMAALFGMGAAMMIN